MRSAVRHSIHASDKAFTAPKLNLIAIEKLLGPCKGFRVISAFESPVPDEMPVRPDSVGSILFHPEAPGLWLADSAHSARLGIAPPNVYGTKRPAINSMICRIPRGTTTHGKTPVSRTGVVAAVTGDLVGVSVQPDMAKQLDDCRRKQEDLPGRPEAIRRLVELGLQAKGK